MSTMGGPEDDPVELIDENKDLFERLADSDLPIAEDAERALELFNEQRGGDE